MSVTVIPILHGSISLTDQDNLLDFLYSILYNNSVKIETANLIASFASLPQVRERSQQSHHSATLAERLVWASASDRAAKLHRRILENKEKAGNETSCAPESKHT